VDSEASWRLASGFTGRTGELFCCAGHLYGVTGYTSSPVPGGSSDAGLVHSALDGDVASLSALLDRYRASLYARALAYLGRPEDAADAVQETFLLALTRLGQVRDPEAFGGWLHAVMRSVCAMELRRPARRVAMAELGSDVPAAQDAVEQLVLRDWVWAALEDLPEPLRLVTLLRFFGRGHSYAEIAQLYGVPVGTVRSRLHQAKAELGARPLAESGTTPRGDAGWTQRVRAWQAGIPNPMPRCSPPAQTSPHPGSSCRDGTRFARCANRTARMGSGHVWST
jgi:RNA polymerase sigma factor (sigma-70 family)